MDIRSIVIEESDLQDFLSTHWRGFDTKDYELFIALQLARLYKKRFGKSYRVGFPIVQYTESEVGTEYAKDKIEIVLNHYLLEDDPVDVLIIDGDTLNEKGGIGKGRGHAYQLKRLGKNSSKDISESMLKYIKEDIPMKYGKMNIDLLLVIGDSGDHKRTHDFVTWDITKIKKAFNPSSYPFNSVKFIYMTTRNSLVFGELWPDFGNEEIDLKDYQFLR